VGDHGVPHAGAGDKGDPLPRCDICATQGRRSRGDPLVKLGKGQTTPAVDHRESVRGGDRTPAQPVDREHPQTVAGQRPGVEVRAPRAAGRPTRNGVRVQVVSKPATLSLMDEARQPRRVVVVDDSPLQCAVWRRLLENRYGERAAVETFSDPVAAAAELGPDIHLLLLDWEMPEMDGKELLAAALTADVNPKRIIITSSHPADRLHEEFDGSGCLAVIEKSEPEQQAAFMMILDSIMRR
jgi:CheY-like chemotaxis protein